MTWHNPPVLAVRIAAFIRGDSRESLDELAAAAFEAAWQADGSYRRLCRRHGVEPAAVDGWRRLPAVTASEAGDAGAPAPDADLARAALDRSLPRAVPELAGRPPIVSLVDDGGYGSPVGPLSAAMLERWGAPDSRVAASQRGVEVAQARSFLGARQRDRRPPLIVGSAIAVVQLIAGLERRGLRFRLPPGSLVVACHEEGTGDGSGWAALAGGLAATMGLPADGLVRAFRLAGTTSWLYARSTPNGRPLSWRPWPWTGVTVRDPDSRAEIATGAAGALSVLDLAAGGPPFQRLGKRAASAAGDGFLLHERPPTVAR